MSAAAEPLGSHEPSGIEARYGAPSAELDPERSKGWFARLSPLLIAHRRLMALVLLAMLAGAGTSISIPWIVGLAVDEALITQQRPLTPLIWLLGGLALASGLLAMIHTYIMRKAVQSMEYDLRGLIYEHLTRLSFSFYDRAQTGQLISRANSDIRAVLMFLGFVPMMTRAALVFAVALGLMIYLHALLTLAAVITLPAVYLFGRTLRSKLFPISWVVQARMADVATIVEENVTGVRIVKSFAAEPSQIGLLAKAAERLRWVSVRQVDIRARFSPIMENMPQLGRALVLLYGGFLAITGEVTVGTLVIFTSYILMLQAPFRILGFVMIMAQRAAASAQRVFDILDEVPEIRDREDAIALVEPRGEIEFRGVSAGYGSDAPILRGLDLRVRPGETVAIVGRTGCGKSTLARLLPRFYDVREGAVLIDGVDVRDYRVKSLRAHIGLVLDEPFLFSQSIRDNIAYGRPDAAAEEVIAAAKAAGAHAFIEELEQGYDTVIGERGYTLSGGQRQRVAIARALLVNPKFLILDDATSSVDVRLEQEIHAALAQLMRGRTTLIIAHRLSTIRLADRVVLLDGGVVLADGTHGALMRDVPEYAEILSRAEEERLDALRTKRVREQEAARPERMAKSPAEAELAGARGIDVPGLDIPEPA